MNNKILTIFALLLLCSMIIPLQSAHALGLIWSGVSKSGSKIGDIADVSDGCTNGQYYKYQTSNSTWICTTISSSGFTNIKNITTGNAFPIQSNSSNTAIFKSFTDSAYITWTNAVGTLTATLGAIPESLVTNLTTDLALKEDKTSKAQNNGYASLGSTGQIPTSQMNGTFVSKTLYNAVFGIPQLGSTGQLQKAQQNGTTEYTTNKAVSNGYASLNSNTIVPSAQLGSGTNSSTTMLRGDRAWSTFVASITGTSNNVTASASTGAVTLNLGSNVVTTGGSAQTITKTVTLNSATLGGQINFNGQTILNTGTITLPTSTGTLETSANKGAASGYTPLNSASLIPSRFLGSGTNSSSNFLRGDNTWSSALVTSITGTANNVTASASTGAITLNLGSNVVTTGGSAQTITKPVTMSGQNVISHSNTGVIIRSVSGAFATTIAGGAVSANRTINTPVVTATDTFATLGLAQTFTALQTFGTATAVGKLAVAGATSGSTIINATAVAGTGFVTLPTSGTLFSGAISTTNQTQASLPTTDKLVFTIPLKVSVPNIISGIMYTKSSVAGTAVNMAFNLTAGVTNGNKGSCHTQAELTATSDTVANLKLPVVLTGRAISTTHTDFITANTPQPINWQCTVQMGTTASNLKVWINPEVTGATISADSNSFYILLPPT